MNRVIQPARNITGSLRLPGDKSISHRYAMLGAMAHGTTVLRRYSNGADCASTLHCLQQLGVAIAKQKATTHSGEQVTEVTIEGRGLGGFQPPKEILDAGNSGTTMRMLSGLLAGHSFECTITGDESLQRRPMRRIMQPLELMGASIQAREGNLPPLRIMGRQLHGIQYETPVASAQVKSAILLAGLLVEGDTIVTEPVATRDHTEIAMAQFGAEITRKKRVTQVHGKAKLQGKQLVVPGDLSSATFFISAALMFEDANLYLQDVGLNPTRTTMLDFLSSLGARVRVSNLSEVNGELVGDIHVSGGKLKGGEINGEMVAGLIDEIPMLCVLGSQTAGGLKLRDAGELRFKETDRLATVAENLKRMGVAVTLHTDGMDIPGEQRLNGAELDSFGDHRIAMAFTVASLVASGECNLKQSEAASVSFPEFFDQLETIVVR